jgi:sugar phosphate permease
MFVASATTAVVDVVLIFLPLYGREIGLSVTDIGILLAIRSIASLAVRLVLGQISNRLGLRTILTWGSIVTLASMVALGLTANFWWIALIMAVSGFAMGIGQPATMAWVSRISSPDSRGIGNCSSPQCEPVRSSCYARTCRFSCRSINCGCFLYARWSSGCFDCCHRHLIEKRRIAGTFVSFFPQRLS